MIDKLKNLELYKNAISSDVKEEYKDWEYDKDTDVIVEVVSELEQWFFDNKNLDISVVRHSSEMITEEYVYKNKFRFQRTQRHGIWFVTHNNYLITFGQYRHDLEEWIDINYKQKL